MKSDKDVTNMIGDGSVGLQVMIEELRKIYARQADLQNQMLSVLEALSKEFDRLSEKPQATQFRSETDFDKPAKAAEASAKPKAKDIDYSDLRKLLASISAAGKTAEVKALINSTGAAKLPEVPKEKWQDLYDKAIALKGDA